MESPRRLATSANGQPEYELLTRFDIGEEWCPVFLNLMESYITVKGPNRHCTILGFHWYGEFVSLDAPTPMYPADLIGMPMDWLELQLGSAEPFIVEEYGQEYPRVLESERPPETSS